MAVKLTKNELKVQKDRLKQFQRYLPTLQLKKQQLQSVVMHVTAQLEAVERFLDGMDENDLHEDRIDHPFALDLGWEILAQCFEPNETGLKSSLIQERWPKSAAAE